MHLVAAMDRVPDVRGVLTLFEGVVSGAADGYARMAGQPGATLLHLGPGFGERVRERPQRVQGAHADGQPGRRPRGRTTPLGAPLTSDIEGLARPARTGCARATRRARSAPTPPRRSRRRGAARRRSRR